MKTKIRKIGNRSVIILPQKMMRELGLKDGDILKVEKKGSVLAFQPAAAEFKEWAEAYRNANIDYKDVLKRLGND